MKSIRPKNPSAWSLRDGTEGCERETELECGSKDKFMKVENLKLPESGGAVVDMEMSLEECPLERIRSQDFLLNSELVSSKKEHYSGDRSNDDLELPLFDFTSIAAATENFSDENKLGQGGFGCVYKGFVEGQKIVVKRLSKNSGQGTKEFKNEVKLIAKLQHRNLVRLLGCCVDADEKMLIYEYMENKSLDSFLFDKAKRYLLDWQKRFNNICGIARGLLDLHQDSRFRIIHRDLKASNILLDGELDPKISDFGMARLFGQDQTEANTKKVVGTYGYMCPEYAMDGLF
ncbi:receptor-like serine/threonine-protein kinase SD1-8 [Rosa rugosa]|uniref:receptor-like serine/threonine-protein kinase SD1-8 n=1 Tax=Rosa rugosa TaxID=74645 RepID=UPI002B40CE85|nr:receptor-like serine/threonine-protein kinase SD1-8 [Rosa rugosa]